jgi:hypothetical protein
MSADGTWKTTINSPMGAQQGTLTVVTSGDTFTGKMDGAQGAQDVSGKVDGDTLTWSASITTPFPMTLEASVKVDGDAMTGTVKAGSFGSFPLTGTRA